MLQSECCYLETIFENIILKQCDEYNKDWLDIEDDYKNYIKFYLISDKILSNIKITDYKSVLDELNLRIPKYKIIYCNSITKSIDYSNIKIT